MRYKNQLPKTQGTRSTDVAELEKITWLNIQAIHRCGSSSTGGRFDWQHMPIGHDKMVFGNHSQMICVGWLGGMKSVLRERERESKQRDQ